MHSISRFRHALRAHTRSSINATHTHTWTDAPTHANTHTHAHTCTRMLSDTRYKHTQINQNASLFLHSHPPPLTAPELADDTTHSASPRTYNAAACAHTRISWRARVTAREDILAVMLPRSRYIARPARPVILTHSSPMTPRDSGREPASVTTARESITRLGDIGAKV
jgi:hypothetical protein